MWLWLNTDQNQLREQRACLVYTSTSQPLTKENRELKPERGGRSWSGGCGEVFFTVLLSRACPTSCLIACMTTCPGCRCPEGTGLLSSLPLCFLQTRGNSRICFLVSFEDYNSFYTKGIEQCPAHRRKYRWLSSGSGRHLSPQKFESQL